MKIVAIGDIHCRVDTPDLIEKLLGGALETVDVVVLAGDLTDTGLPEEAEALIPQLQALQRPVVAILGNHDHESGCADQIQLMLSNAGVIMLDASAAEIDGVGFVGTKGFCGGFGTNQVNPFGENALKTFIRTAMDEAHRLEGALAGLKTTRKVGVLHYAPIPETLAGEPPEIFAFLGTSRLAAAMDRWGADFIVHGHAHHGSPFGRTPGSIPVYNVCRFVQMQHNGKPYCEFDL